MNKKVIIPVGIVLLLLVVLGLIFARPGAAQTSPDQNEESMDPQMLMIPRWFLESLTLDGQPVELLQDRQTVQFEEDGRANGFGGCNNYFTTYQATNDGSITFSETGATKMFCEIGSTQETAYFNALARVTKFSVEAGKLTLASADGQTVLVYTKPPK